MHWPNQMLYNDGGTKTRQSNALKWTKMYNLKQVKKENEREN